jgi:DNA mismatch repair protein MutS2
MDKTTLETLEYPLILSELSRYGVTPYGRELILALKPALTLQEIKIAFAELAEAIDCSARSGSELPLIELIDVRESLKKLTVAGVYLLSDEFTALRDQLGVVSNLKGLINETFSSKYPLMSERLSALSEPGELYVELKRVFDDKGQITDRASSALYAIRKEIRSARSRAIRILDSIRGSDKFDGFFQEEFFTIRDDRYALAIKTGFHTRFPGVVHGRSSSGETYFIEPMEVVELNNRQNELYRDEKAEEILILKLLTSMVGERRGELNVDIELIASFDFLRARCVLSKVLDLNIPQLAESGISLKNARHPLLVLKELKGELQVRPVDIILDEALSVLVISGANTGGKTVALKSLGLMTLMAQSAIPIPADSGSRVRVFDTLFADIGDRQGIEESLSTFSAHIKRMGLILDSAGPGTLVLIDEIGVGTDPTEGSVLALAVLEELKERGAVAVVTTHINLLKAHAEQDALYMNASVIFDDKTMRPSYNLSYGTPGPSLGLSIAESLGIPISLITRARAMLGTDEGAFIESLAKLDDEKKRLAGVSERLELLETRRNEAVEGLRSERKKIIEKIRVKAEKVRDKSFGEIEAALKVFNEKLAEAGEVKEGSKKMSAITKEAKARIDEAARSLYAKESEPEELYIPRPDDRVEIIGTKTRGVVISVDEGEAELLVGKMKVRVPYNKLRDRGGTSKGPRPEPRAIVSAPATELKLSVNIIGMRVDEAIKVITPFIDNAHVNGAGSVEIIHGIGTGALKRGVREFLGENPVVKSFIDAELTAGGAGVTMVELR